MPKQIKYHYPSITWSHARGKYANIVNTLYSPPNCYPFPRPPSAHCPEIKHIRFVLYDYYNSYRKFELFALQSLPWNRSLTHFINSIIIIILKNANLFVVITCYISIMQICYHFAICFCCLLVCSLSLFISCFHKHVLLFFFSITFCSLLFYVTVICCSFLFRIFFVFSSFGSSFFFKRLWMFFFALTLHLTVHSFLSFFSFFSCVLPNPGWCFFRLA